MLAAAITTASPPSRARALRNRLAIHPQRIRAPTAAAFPAANTHPAVSGGYPSPSARNAKRNAP